NPSRMRTLSSSSKKSQQTKNGLNVYSKLPTLTFSKAARHPQKYGNGLTNMPTRSPSRPATAYKLIHLQESKFTKFCRRLADKRSHLMRNGNCANELLSSSAFATLTTLPSLKANSIRI